MECDRLYHDRRRRSPLPAAPQPPLTAAAATPPCPAPPSKPRHMDPAADPDRFALAAVQQYLHEHGYNKGEPACRQGSSRAGCV